MFYYTMVQYDSSWNFLAHGRTTWNLVEEREERCTVKYGF
jgi:hypothetical protein